MGLVFYVYTIFDDDKVLYSESHSKEFFNGAGIQAIMCATGVTIVAGELNTYFFKISDSIFRKLSRQLLFLLSPIFFVIIVNKVTTDNIKKGLAIYDIEFKYDTSRIKTDTNIVYVGATQNYLFLRERMIRKNYLYKIDKIDSLSIKKISYKLDRISWRK